MSVQKYGRCVGEAKWHDKEFERPVLYCACYFGLISLGDVNLVVPGAQVKFSEVLHFAKLVEKICYQGNQILGLDNDLVERFIIDEHL